MHSRDIEKLLKAGFTLLRPDNHPTPRIKVLRVGDYVAGTRPEWVTLEKDFPCKAARDRRMDELLQDDKTIDA